MDELKKRLNRALKRLILTPEDWDALIKDFQQGEPKSIICAKYNIKSGDYKHIKRQIMGDING